MAERVATKDALKKLDAQLECSICFDTFKQPKLLPCFRAMSFVSHGPHCMSVFTSQGDYITMFGGRGSEEGQFMGIYGLSINNSDSIIASDSDNGRLQIY